MTTRENPNRRGATLTTSHRPVPPVTPPSTGVGSYRVTFAVLSVGVLAFGLLQSLLVPVLPLLQEKLHTTSGDVTWVMTTYLLSASVCTPIVGRLGDMLGKRTVLVVVLLTLAAGCAVSVVATSLPVMLAGRVLQGVGGGVLPLSFGIIRDEFPADRMTGGVGAMATLIGLGVGSGVALAGPIVDGLGYHWIFLIPMIAMLASAVAARVLIPPSPRLEGGRVNVLSASLLTVWLVALLLAVSRGNIWGWASPTVWGLLVTALAFAVLWARSESRATTPLIDLKMMRLRTVWTANLAVLLLGSMTFSTMASVAILAQIPTSSGHGIGASVTQAGLIMTPSTLLIFVSGVAAGRIRRSIGARTTLQVGLVLATVSLVVMAFWHDTALQLTITYGVVGVGAGLALSSMATIIVGAVPPSQTGVASGMNANIRTLGGAIGVAMVTAILTGHMSSSGVPEDAGFTMGFLAVAGATALALLVTLLIPSASGAGRPATSRDELEAQVCSVAGGSPLSD